MLALSAKPNANYTVWTIALRHGVQFHDGTNFDASVVVANYTAWPRRGHDGWSRYRRQFVASVKEVNSYTVGIQHGHPVRVVSDPARRTADCIYGGTIRARAQLPPASPSARVPSSSSPGPFRLSSHSSTKNEKYWRKDGAGRRLPYLDGISFKTIVDSASRNEAPGRVATST